MDSDRYATGNSVTWFIKTKSSLSSAAQSLALLSSVPAMQLVKDELQAKREKTHNMYNGPVKQNMYFCLSRAKICSEPTG